MTVELVTIKRVPLAKEGDWPVQRGYGQFTAEDLASMARHAARGMAPRIKIGHGDKGLGAMPAWGQVRNLEVGEDEQGTPTLFGDYVNVPKKLAAVMPSAFPGRSIEARRGTKSSEGMRATALALLGTEEPAMSTLGDHDTIDGLHSVMVEETELVVHAARILDDMTPEELTAALVAGADSRGDYGENDPGDDRVSDDAAAKATADAEAKAASDKAAADAAAKAEADEKAKADAAEAKAKDDAEKAAAGEGDTVTIPTSDLVALQERITALESAQGEAVAAGRASALDEAEADRRINDLTRPAFEAWMQTDEAGCRDALAKLPAWNGGGELINAERGHAGDPASLDNDLTPDQLAAYEARYGKTEA